MTRKLSKLLASLADANSKIIYRSLADLSDLNRQEVEQFQAAWRDFMPDRRQELAQALVELAEDHVEYDFRAIFRWTLTDPDPRIRRLSIEGLWEDAAPALLPHYQRLLGDEAVEVRAAAAMALGRMTYWSECGDVDESLAEIAAESLWQVYHDEQEHVEVRRRALEGLAFSSRPGVTRLIEQAYYGAETAMRASVLYAMGRSADRRWIPFLVPELRRDEAALRLEAVRSLGELEARAAVQPLIEMMMAENDIEVLLVAILALGQIGGKDARRALESLTDSDNEVLVEASQAALDDLLQSEGSDFELINEILGLDEFDEGEDAGSRWDEDFYEDPLEEEIRRLLDERDD